MTSALHTVLWDLDGTLLDSTSLWRSAEYEFLRKRGLNWNDKASEQLIGGNFDKMSIVFAEVTGHHFPVSLLQEELNALMLASLQASLPWAPGAHELVQDLASSGIRQGIVTSSHREIVAAVIADTDIFDEGLIITREDVTNPKPHPEPYMQAVQRLSHAEQKTGVLVIEDSASGITSAHSAGLPVIALGKHYDHPPGVVQLSSLVDCSPNWLQEQLNSLNPPTPSCDSQY